MQRQNIEGRSLMRLLKLALTSSPRNFISRPEFERRTKTRTLIVISEKLVSPSIKDSSHKLNSLYILSSEIDRLELSNVMAHPSHEREQN